MTREVPGWPRRFPVRDDGVRPLRYRVMSWLCRTGFRVVIGRGLRIEGEENIPSGPFLLVSNHLSNLDPLLYGGFFPRTLFAMAKRELFPNRAVSWLLSGCNVFPVDRGAADRRALRIAMDICRRPEGHLLLFVEGTRARRPGMKRAEQGTGFLMRRAGVPVLPAAVWGTENALVRGRFLPRRVPVRVRYGRPFTSPADGPAARDSQAAADLAAAHVAALLPPEYRGVYADEAARVAAGEEAGPAGG